MPKSQTMVAIETLAQAIEHTAVSDLTAPSGHLAEIDGIAAQYCTTRDVYVRALQIGLTVSALIDNLDWPMETKLACRELLAALGQQDVAWMAELRRRQGFLN